jgi:hypothetical protein
MRVLQKGKPAEFTKEFSLRFARAGEIRYRAIKLVERRRERSAAPFLFLRVMRTSKPHSRAKKSDSMAVMTIEWRADTVRMIDQRLLPAREVIRTYRDYRGVAEAIRTMVIRGAPAIGVAAAMGVALGIKGTAGAKAKKRFDTVAKALKATRPTAVNLAWAVERMGRILDENLSLDAAELFQRMRGEAIAVYTEDIAANRAMGKFGAELIGDPAIVLTHCNAGALATADPGVRRRDAAIFAGLAPDCVGAAQRSDPGNRNC